MNNDILSLGLSGNSKQRRKKRRYFNRVFTERKTARYTIPQLVQIRIDSRKLYHMDEKDFFTCDKCRGATVCYYSFDGYNINGDCLAEK